MSPDDKTTVSRPLDPVTVTVITAGDASKLQDGAIARTEGDHQPDYITRAISPLVAIAIRFANAYVTTLVGLLTVGLTTKALPAPDFLHLVVKCGSLALAGPGVALGKDLVTVLGRLEQKYPLMSGSV